MQTCKRMLALKDNCLHPTTKKTYVKSYGGGRDNSPEGHQVIMVLVTSSVFAVGLIKMQGGFTHGFVSEFESDGDRKYYLEKDPAHLEFVTSLEDVVQNVRVLDFQPGVY